MMTSVWRTVRLQKTRGKRSARLDEEVGCVWSMGGGEWLAAGRRRGAVQRERGKSDNDREQPESSVKERGDAELRVGNDPSERCTSRLGNGPVGRQQVLLPPNQTPRFRSFGTSDRCKPNLNSRQIPHTIPTTPHNTQRCLSTLDQSCLRLSLHTPPPATRHSPVRPLRAPYNTPQGLPALS